MSCPRSVTPNQKRSETLSAVSATELNSQRPGTIFDKTAVLIVHSFTERIEQNQNLTNPHGHTSPLPFSSLNRTCLLAIPYRFTNPARLAGRCDDLSRSPQISHRRDPSPRD